MIFIETPVFSTQLKKLMDDDCYRELQEFLCEFPLAGDVISGTGGIRKIRTAAKGHGKSGGARVIYYYFAQNSSIALLMIYPKNRQDDLTCEQRKLLRRIVGHWSE